MRLKSVGLSTFSHETPSSPIATAAPLRLVGDEGAEALAQRIVALQPSLGVGDAVYGVPPLA
jgi:hypothetical protein